MGLLHGRGLGIEWIVKLTVLVGVVAGVVAGFVLGDVLGPIQLTNYIRVYLTSSIRFRARVNKL